jgi:cytochrome c551
MKRRALGILTDELTFSANFTNQSEAYMRKIWFTSISMFLVLSMAACGRQAPAPAAPAPPAAGNTGGTTGGNAGAATVDAQALYKQNCMSCHGVDLSGGVGPNLQHVGARLTTAQITDRISNGGGGMPPFKGTLKDPEIAALSEWLAAKK